MGILEFGHICLYPLCWHPSKPGGPHLQGQICQSGPMDSGTGPGQRSIKKEKKKHNDVFQDFSSIFKFQERTKNQQYENNNSNPQET